MKNLLFAAFFFVSAIGFSQEGVNFSKNTVTMKETAPVWPGCEDSEQASKDCWNQKLVEHLKANFKYPRDENGKIIRGKAIVSFNINEEGKVEIKKVEGDKAALKAEAERIVQAIPQMKPGQMGGKPISVGYKVPFTF